MGTKGGKPLSTLEKRQKKIEKKEEKKSMAKEEKKEVAMSAVDPSLVRKVAEDIKNTTFVTTFTLVQKYGIRYGVAKKILKTLASQGLADITLKTRRVIIATSSKPSAG